MTWTIRPRCKLGALAAISNGAGPEVLLVHGVGLRAEAWCGQLGALAQRCHVLAVDLPGHGESPRLGTTPKISAFTDAIAVNLTKPMVVVGHSFGAMIALDIATRYPGLVHGVAALNGIFRRDTSAKEAVLARSALLDGMTAVDPSVTLTRWFGSDPSTERDACQTWLSEIDPAGYRDAYRVFAAEDGPSAEALQNLTCPALFLTGADEPNSTPQMSRRMASLAPLGKAVVVEGASHMLPMTHARQVSTILQHFIQDCAR